MSDKLQRFLEVSSKFSKPGFSQLLGTDALTAKKALHSFDIGTKTRVKDHNSYSYSFPYKIPSHACVSQNKNIHAVSSKSQLPFLPLSGYLAIFDDFTTLALVNEDRKTRPGLSISLSAQLGPHCSGSRSSNSSNQVQQNQRMPTADEDIDIKVRVTKVGNIFGFAEAKAVCCDSGRIIASGKHIKYLPIGPWYHELALGPLLPLSALVASLFDKDKGGEGVIVPQHTMEEALRVEQNESSDGSSVNFNVEGHHCNPLGSLHGGCQAMLMEKIGNDYISRNYSNCDEQPLHTLELESIHVTYKSQGKNNVTFETEIDESGYEKSSSIGLNIQALDAKGTVISEGALRYQRETKR